MPLAARCLQDRSSGPEERPGFSRHCFDVSIFMPGKIGLSAFGSPSFSPVSMAPSSEITNPASITQRYDALVAAGTIERDFSQIDLVRRLDSLADELGKRQNGNGLFGFARLLGFGNGNGSADAEKGRGLYIWGPVGRGKTMLMDLFFDN